MPSVGYCQTGARATTMERKSVATKLLMVAMVAMFAAPAASQSPAPETRVSQPPSLTKKDTNRSGRRLRLESMVPLPSSGRETIADLDIVLLQSKIWNANSKMFDKVELRAYQDRNRPAHPDRPYVAPTLEAAPGDTVRVFIRNRLPADTDPACVQPSGDINIPHCFNTTNLHSHGLWVSPAGISDNVLRTLVPNPSFTYEYEYNIPADHPSGTFWYHPHVHGSTAIQVASGLAGALIIRGDRLPEFNDSGVLLKGDLDVLMRRDGAPLPDYVFVLQQIQYICREPGSTQVPPSKRNPDGTWRCDEGEIGRLDGYDVFGGARWDNSGRFTTVNGATAALLEQKATVGIPERWRFVHGGVADTIRVSIRKKRAPQPVPLATLARASEQTAFVDTECAPENDALPQFEIAADGLTRHQISQRNSTTLQPGYRSDLLVAFSEPGTYCVVDEEVPVQAGVEGGARRKQLLFTVEVEAGSQNVPRGTPREIVGATLLAAANALPIADAALKKQVTDDIASLKLTNFAPHDTLSSATVNTFQKLYFTLTQGKTRLADGTYGPPLGAGIGHAPDTLRRFDPNDFQRTLVIGNTDEWELHVLPPPAIGHPFHIHVNPFEIMSVERNGVDLTADPNSQYFGMKNVWKDTIFVEPDAVVKFRTHYKRYVGDFVLHCHILNHEDAGMMEMVRIADRDANGGPLPFGHGLVDTSRAVPGHQHR